MSMTVDPATETLYTAVGWYTPDSAWSSALGIIDPETGDVTRIGPTQIGLEALAIQATPEPSCGFLMSAGILLLLAFRRKLRLAWR
jgi:hypothetical protein